VKFCLMFANAGPSSEPEYAIAVAQLCEQLGFESIWTVEHVVVPSGYQSQYPYSDNGRMPGGEDVPIPDPLIWLAFVAAATKSIRLATGILILPQRNPVILAKEIATLDRLSGGRVELGVGVGWLEEEFDALGVPFAERGKRTDEYIEVLRKLWREPESTHQGSFTAFAPLKSYPKPAAKEGPPIHIGGHTPAAARRAGRLGDGFFPGRTGEDLDSLLDIMRKTAVDAGRNPDAIEVTSGGGLDLDAVLKAADLGVDRYVVPPLGFDIESLKTNLGNYADNIMAKSP
jgi:probable F420-dependent oxidoreductase